MHIRTSLSLACGLAAAAMFASVPVHASLDIVTNGGFETGDFTGWTQTGDPGFTAVDTVAPEEGTYAAYFGPATPGGIHQILPTLPGRWYNVGFWLQNEADVTGLSTPNSFAFNWDGGAPEMSLTDSPAFGYTHETFSLLATSATTDLSFTFTQIPAFWDLDNVTASVPEPGSLALVALAGSLVALARRRQTTPPRKEVL